MRRPLSAGIVSGVVRRLIALKPECESLWGGRADEDSPEWCRIERQLRRSASSDLHALQIAEILEKRGLRPRNFHIENAATAVVFSEPSELEIRRRGLCPECKGVRYVTSLMMRWRTMQMGDLPRTRVKVVGDRAAALAELDHIEGLIDGDVYEAARPCPSCTKAEAR